MTQNLNPVVKSLEQALADTFALALKTQNYHWNVVSPNFFGLHTMFEEQYDDMHAAVDELAERIRALGATAPGSLRAFLETTSIADAIDDADAIAMLDDLIASQAMLAKTLKAGVAAAEKAGDTATADMLTERLTRHDKQAWMLRATRG
ncbi:MAG: DNA starvation/stationary phase protection protein [Alphaproteobacteria bacterium]|nr:DNA starvation/stationary phase protection protein [Alphaproteobacteria bacterium]